MSFVVCAVCCMCMSCVFIKVYYYIVGVIDRADTATVATASAVDSDTDLDTGAITSSSLVTMAFSRTTELPASQSLRSGH